MSPSSAGTVWSALREVVGACDPAEVDLSFCTGEELVPDFTGDGPAVEPRHRTSKVSS